MPEFTRQLPPSNDIVVAGGTIGIDGSTFTFDLLEAGLSVNGGLTDDTGAGDARRKYLGFGNAWVIGRLQLRGWLLGSGTFGLANVGTGTELDATLTLQDTHTVAGKLTVGTCRLGTAQRNRRGVALTGMFTAIAEADS